MGQAVSGGGGTRERVNEHLIEPNVVLWDGDEYADLSFVGLIRLTRRKNNIAIFLGDRSLSRAFSRPLSLR